MQEADPLRGAELEQMARNSPVGSPCIRTIKMPAKPAFPCIGPVPAGAVRRTRVCCACSGRHSKKCLSNLFLSLPRSGSRFWLELGGTAHNNAPSRKKAVCWTRPRTPASSVSSKSPYVLVPNFAPYFPGISHVIDYPR